jgi:hypothetical protein
MAQSSRIISKTAPSCKGCSGWRQGNCNVDALVARLACVTCTVGGHRRMCVAGIAHAVQQGFTGRVPLPAKAPCPESHLWSSDADSDTDPDPDKHPCRDRDAFVQSSLGPVHYPIRLAVISLTDSPTLAAISVISSFLIRSSSKQAGLTGNCSNPGPPPNPA